MGRLVLNHSTHIDGLIPVLKKLALNVNVKTRRSKMTEWLVTNWEWVLLGFMVLEKIVKMSPSKKDDILLDSIIRPLFEMLKPKK